MIYENPTIEISIGEHPVVSGVEYNVISKFEIDQLRFDGPIDIKFLRYPLLLPSFLFSSFVSSLSRFFFFNIFILHFVFGSPHFPLCSLSSKKNKKKHPLPITVSPPFFSFSHFFILFFLVFLTFCSKLKKQ